MPMVVPRGKRTFALEVAGTRTGPARQTKYSNLARTGRPVCSKSLLRSEGDGTLEVVTNGNQLALAPTGGNVGVGTNTPGATLDVAGEAVVRGNASFGGGNQSSLVKIDSQGSQTVGLQLGPDPELSPTSADGRRRLLDANASSVATTSSQFNKRSFGVYSLVGGEQVVVKRR